MRDFSRFPKSGSRSAGPQNTQKNFQEASSSYRKAKGALIVLLGILILWPIGRYYWREHRWRWIVLHHTGSDTGDLATIRRLHQGKGWKDAAYHFIINNGSRGTVAGQIEISDRWKARENAGSTRRSIVNTFAIAVVLVGNLERHSPPLQQREALLNLLVRLSKEYDIPVERIRGHGELQRTKCPGRYLQMQEIRSELQRRLRQAD